MFVHLNIILCLLNIKDKQFYLYELTLVVVRKKNFYFQSEINFIRIFINKKRL